MSGAKVHRRNEITKLLRDFSPFVLLSHDFELPLHTYINRRDYPMTKIKVQNTEITIVSHNDDDYISLTDMARSQLQEHIIFRWLSLKSTIE